MKKKMQAKTWHREALTQEYFEIADSARCSSTPWRHSILRRYRHLHFYLNHLYRPRIVWNRISTISSSLVVHTRTIFSHVARKIRLFRSLNLFRVDLWSTGGDRRPPQKNKKQNQIKAQPFPYSRPVNVRLVYQSME